MKHSTMGEHNPYRSPRQPSGGHPIAVKPSRWLALRPSAMEGAFLFVVACASGYSHFAYHKIQAILHVNSTFSAILVETILFALVGCGLVAIRCRVPRTKRIMSATTGAIVAAIVTVGICWTLIRTGQPPNGLLLLVSVAAGMTATKLLVRPMLGDDPNPFGASRLSIKPNNEI